MSLDASLTLCMSAKWNATASPLAGHTMEITYQAYSARKSVTRNVSLSRLTALFLHLSAACLEDIILNDLPFPQQYEISVQNLFTRGCLHRHVCLAMGKNTSVHRLAYLPLRASSMPATKEDLSLICSIQFSVTASWSDGHSFPLLLSLYSQSPPHRNAKSCVTVW